MCISFGETRALKPIFHPLMSNLPDLLHPDGVILIHALEVEYQANYPISQFVTPYCLAYLMPPYIYNTHCISAMGECQFKNWFTVITLEAERVCRKSPLAENWFPDQAL
jgi:hypothetical protein